MCQSCRMENMKPPHIGSVDFDTYKATLETDLSLEQIDQVREECIKLASSAGRDILSLTEFNAIVDRVMLNGRKPCVPSFHRTDSRNQLPLVIPGEVLSAANAKQNKIVAYSSRKH